MLNITTAVVDYSAGKSQPEGVRVSQETVIFYHQDKDEELHLKKQVVMWLWSVGLMIVHVCYQ